MLGKGADTMKLVFENPNTKEKMVSVLPKLLAQALYEYLQEENLLPNAYFSAKEVISGDYFGA